MTAGASTLRRRSTFALGPAALLALHAANQLPLAYARGEGGTFVFGRGGDSVKLDPAVVTDGESFRATAQVLETLVQFQGSTTDIKPALARSWDISPDGMTYWFHVREGVTFHDGTPLDAAAVKWNFDRWGDETNPYHIGGDFEYYTDTAGFSDAISSVEVPDPMTVQVNLAFPQAPFLLNLALPAFAINSPTAFAADPDNAFKNPVGTGPFRFVEWVPGDRVVLDKNASYWGDVANLDRVVIRTIPDNAARFLALRSGSIDMMEGINPEDLPNARRDRNLSVILRPSMNIAYIAFNFNMKPFDNVKVRQAVGAAINRPAIIEALYGGIGSVATQLIPSYMLGYNPDVRGPQYDQARAKQLLAEAGYPNGFTTDFWYMPVSRPYYPSPQPIAEAFKADLAKVGITANLKTEDWGTYLNDRAKQKFPVYMLGWTGDNGDTDNFLGEFYRNTDNTWSDAAVKAKLDQAIMSPDSGERDALYREVIKAMDDVAWKIPVAHTTPPLVARAYVKGYVPHPTAEEYYFSVWLDK